MPYTRSHRNIHRTVVARAKRLVESQPWNMGSAERSRVLQTFLEKSLKDYGHDVNVRVRTSFYAPGTYGFYVQPVDTQEDALGEDRPIYSVTFGERYSTPPVFTALRYLERMLAGEDGWAEEERHVDWANSLLFTVAPVLFRKLARKGRLFGVRPIDTFSDENAELLERNGYTCDDGTLTHNLTWASVLEELREAEAERQEEEDEDDETIEDADPEVQRDAMRGVFGIQTEAEASAALTSFFEPAEASESPQEAISRLRGSPIHSSDADEVLDPQVPGVTAPGLDPLPVVELRTAALEDMNRDQVRAEARRCGIRNVSSRTRSELVDMIRARAGL